MTKNKFPKESFNLRESKGKNYYKIMMVNEALKDYSFKSEFPWLLYFEIEMKDVTRPFNLPTESEAQVLNDLEDSLVGIIKSTIPYQFIGRVTDAGKRELYFYLSDPKEVHEKLSDLIKKDNQTREFEYSIERDNSWEKVNFFFDY